MSESTGFMPSDDTRLRALRASGLLHYRAGGAFDAEIALVRKALGVPVALVSLVEDDRQVFAGQQGLPEPWATLGETPLTHSFCQHVVAQGAPFSVPDAYDEPLVEGNLAIADLGVRAYLGVPLRLPTGEIAGALAAIASAPRQWTPHDLSVLQTVAEVVGKSIRAGIAERKWRGIFAGMQEGFILGEVIRDAGGKVADWRYTEVNRAWGELVGIPSEQAAGRTIRELFPGIEDAWVAEFADVVETQQPIAFTRQVGDLQRWYDGFAQPAGDDSFIVLFIEVTERVLANRRRDALVELGDRLREVRSIGEAAYTGAAIMARVLDASRAGFGTVDAQAETVSIQPDWCAPGIASIAGQHSFRDFGSYIEELKRGETVIVADVAADPRTQASAANFDALAIRQLVNVPIMAQGTLAVIMFLHYAALRTLSADEVQFVMAVADRTQAAMAQLQAEADQTVLNQELSHRMKNTLALVQAIATQTLRGVSEREPVKALERRLLALSTAHDILLQRDAGETSLAAVVRGALAGLGQAERAALGGPSVPLGARSALTLALLVHELATNALKHGALSVPDGYVTIAWETAGEDLAFHWEEHGGPPAVEPTRKGLGSRLIAAGLVGSGATELHYGADGFRATMRALLPQLRV